MDYLLALSAWLRARAEVRLGPSPRALLQAERLTQGLALLEGRAYLVPENLQLRAAIPHRLLLRLEAELSGLTPEGVVEGALKAVPVPVEAAHAASFSSPSSWPSPSPPASSGRRPWGWGFPGAEGEARVEVELLAPLPVLFRGEVPPHAPSAPRPCA